jgi:hypothetical protein
MERLLITATEFRAKQVQHKIMEKDEAIRMANQAFPFFMELINNDLVSSSGCGQIFNIHALLKRIDVSDLPVMGTYNYGTYVEETIRLLEDQFDDITDFRYSLSGDLISITVNDQD